MAYTGKTSPLHARNANRVMEVIAAHYIRNLEAATSSSGFPTLRGMLSDRTNWYHFTQYALDRRVKLDLLEIEAGAKWLIKRALANRKDLAEKLTKLRFAQMAVRPSSLALHLTQGTSK